MFKRALKGAIAAVFLSVGVLGWTGVAEADHEKDCQAYVKDGTKFYSCKRYYNHAP